MNFSNLEYPELRHEAELQILYVPLDPKNPVITTTEKFRCFYHQCLGPMMTDSQCDALVMPRGVFPEQPLLNLSDARLVNPHGHIPHTHNFRVALIPNGVPLTDTRLWAREALLNAMNIATDLPDDQIFAWVSSQKDAIHAKHSPADFEGEFDSYLQLQNSIQPSFFVDYSQCGLLIIGEHVWHAKDLSRSSGLGHLGAHRDGSLYVDVFDELAFSS